MQTKNPFLTRLNTSRLRCANERWFTDWNFVESMHAYHISYACMGGKECASWGTCHEQRIVIIGCNGLDHEPITTKMGHNYFEFQSHNNFCNNHAMKLNKLALVATYVYALGNETRPARNLMVGETIIIRARWCRTHIHTGCIHTAPLTNKDQSDEPKLSIN